MLLEKKHVEDLTILKHTDLAGCWNYVTVISRSGRVLDSYQEWNPNCTTTAEYTIIQKTK